jgi:hypothetical protein
MGWERRQKGPSTGYFYRSVRVGGRVVKVYLGRGAAGQEAAAAMELKQQARRDAEAAVQEETDETADAEQLADELADWADSLSAVWLIAAGHHQHHGEWRRRTRADEEST